MLLSWIRAKRAEYAARRATAEAQAQIVEAAADPWGVPAREPDEADWLPLERPAFMLPHDREAVLAKARELHLKNAIARGIVETHVSFIVGDGFRVRALADDAGIAAAADNTLAELAANMHFRQVAEEAVRRYFRDGECFIRLFPHHRQVRFIEPEDVRSNSDAWPDGIETAAADALDVLRYHTDRFGAIEAAEILHLKHGVDANVPRGLPLLYPVLERIRRFDTWLDDLGALIKVRTAVALIRKHQSNPDTVRSFADARKTGTVTRSEGTLRLQKIRPGTIIDASGIEYEFKSPNVDASDLGQYGRSVLLSVAAGVGLAEYMVSADASNNNYSSIEVAETVPFQRFAHYKRYFADAFAEMLQRLLAPATEFQDVRIACEPAPLPVRNEAARTSALSQALADNVMSSQTYAARLGLDWQQEQQLRSAAP